MCHNSCPEFIIYAAPLLPPTPEVLVINATVLQLTWEPPFAWSEYPVLNYTVRMHNSSSPEPCTWTRTIPATVNTVEVFSSESAVSVYCHELVFYVTATNDIGESNQGIIRGGFPVGELFTENKYRHCIDSSAVGNDMSFSLIILIVPGEFNFSYITHEVCFRQFDGNPQLEISFKVRYAFILSVYL